MAEFQRIFGVKDFPPALRGAVVATGNFDGLHRGHQAVLTCALELSRSKQVPAIVLTFEPHPRQVFRRDFPLFRLTPAPMKANLIRALGFQAVVEQPFTHEFSQLSAEEFASDVLQDALGASHVVIGFNFQYGKGRSGTPEVLAQAGKHHRFEVSRVEPFSDESSEVVSSSRIRRLLTDGDVAEAAGLLGYRYTVTAKVRKGKQLGRRLGFPTANMILPAETGLGHGIYAVRFRRENGHLHNGVASFGRRPTVDDDGAPLLETFLFDFSGDLYGETCSVSFFGYLRGEEKFADLEALTAQMKQDEAEARALLANVRPLSELDRVIAW